MFEDKFNQIKDELIKVLDEANGPIEVKKAVDLFWQLLDEAPYKQGFFQDNIHLVSRIAQKAVEFNYGHCEILRNSKGMVVFGLLHFDDDANVDIKFARYDDGSLKYIVTDRNSDGHPEYRFELDEDKNLVYIALDENSDGNKEILRTRDEKLNDYFMQIDSNSNGEPEIVFYGAADAVRFHREINL